MYSPPGEGGLIMDEVFSLIKENFQTFTFLTFLFLLCLKAIFKSIGSAIETVAKVLLLVIAIFRGYEYGKSGDTEYRKKAPDRQNQDESFDTKNFTRKTTTNKVLDFNQAKKEAKKRFSGGHK